jgi:hypothetical protein
MIEPEIDHYFLQLALRVDRAQYFGLLEFGSHDAGWITKRADDFALLRRSVREKAIALIGAHEIWEIDQLIRGHIFQRGQALIFWQG